MAAAGEAIAVHPAVMKSCCPSCRSPREDPINIVSVASVWNNCSRCGWVWRKSLLETLLVHAGDRFGQFRETLKLAGVPAEAGAAITAPAHVPIVLTESLETDDTDAAELRECIVDPDKIAASVEDEIASWGRDAQTQVVRGQVLARLESVSVTVEDELASWGGEVEPEALASSRKIEAVRADEIDALDNGLLVTSTIRSATDQKIRTEETFSTTRQTRTLTPLIEVWCPPGPIQAEAPLHAEVAVLAQEAPAVVMLAPLPEAAASPVLPASPVQPDLPADALPPPVQDHQRLTASVDRTLQNVDDLCDVFVRLQQQLAGLERSCEALLAA